MDPENSEPTSEREQTDESLRVEREKADRALEETLSAIDETADAVVRLARDRADEVVAAARAKTDRDAPVGGPAARVSRKAIAKERIGLYISKCIVQGHGGQIWAESRVGEGSTFVFTLPVPGAP